MNKKSGFYIFELILIIFLTAIVLKFTINGALNFFNSQILKAQAEKLYQTIYALKNRAQLQNKKIEIKINTNQNIYSYENQQEKLNKNIKFGFLENSFGPPSSPNKKITKACTFKNDTIKIEPNGEINPGTIYLTDKNQKFMSAISIGIAKTIFIRKYSYKNNKFSPLK